MKEGKIVLLASALEGFIDAFVLESKRFSLIINEKHDNFVVCEGTQKNIANFIMCSQTAQNIMVYLGKISNDLVIEDFSSKITDFIKENNLKFKILPEYSSRNDCKIIGQLIEKETGLKADINDYEITFGLLKENDYYLGVQVYKKEFSKRDYRVYPSKQSSNPLLYSSLLELANIKDNLVFLDPLCQDGTFGIEYALRSSQGIRMHESHLLEKNFLSLFFTEGFPEPKFSEPKEKLFFSDEQMNNLSKAKQNARLAGVERSISFGRVPIQYLVLKHEKSSIGIITTKLPLVSKLFGIRKYESLISRLLKSSSMLLKKDHKIVMISNEKQLIQKKLLEQGFELIKIYDYKKGESILYGVIASNKGVKNGP